MAFSPFPDTGYFYVLDATEHYVGAFNVAERTELKHIQTVLFIRGTLGGTERLRLNLYGTKEIASTPIASSDWFDVNTGVGGYTNNWIGNVFFDFTGVPINENLDYHVGIESDNYTRNLDTFYFAVRLDWNVAVNTNSPSSLAAMKMNILGLR